MEGCDDPFVVKKPQSDAVDMANYLKSKHRPDAITTRWKKETKGSGSVTSAHSQSTSSTRSTASSTPTGSSGRPASSRDNNSSSQLSSSRRSDGGRRSRRRSVSSRDGSSSQLLDFGKSELGDALEFGATSSSSLSSDKAPLHVGGGFDAFDNSAGSDLLASHGATAYDENNSFQFPGTNAFEALALSPKHTRMCKNSSSFPAFGSADAFSNSNTEKNKHAESLSTVTFGGEQGEKDLERFDGDPFWENVRDMNDSCKETRSRGKPILGNRLRSNNEYPGSRERIQQRRRERPPRRSSGHQKTSPSGGDSGDGAGSKQRTRRSKSVDRRTATRRTSCDHKSNNPAPVAKSEQSHRRASVGNRPRGKSRERGVLRQKSGKARSNTNATERGKSDNGARRSRGTLAMTRSDGALKAVNVTGTNRRRNHPLKSPLATSNAPDKLLGPHHSKALELVARMQLDLEAQKKNKPAKSKSSSGSKPAVSDKPQSWKKERSRNQELIMNMHRGDPGNSKGNNNNGSDSSLRLNVDMEAMVFADEVEKLKNPIDGGSTSMLASKLGNLFSGRPKALTVGDEEECSSDIYDSTVSSGAISRQSVSSGDRLRKKSAATDGRRVPNVKSYTDRDMNRSRANLLERVSVDEIAAASPVKKPQGMSYSDRILLGMKK